MMLKCDKVRCRYLKLKLVNQLSTKLYVKSVFDSEKVCNACLHRGNLMKTNGY